ncbi:alcohol dehydrogenase catalytic domain-containing protein [Roseovarius sp. 2305UL8-3]|uniref:alcohol dehydrogenase catalytic domain-containing protein n=1 Tax=Roseovarius conchicola TaxID=3121636 RepID=UPI0035284947
MKAAVMSEFGGALPLETVADPECPRDGAIVMVRACGVCRSDHHAWKGADPDVALPHIMGHEFSGDVIATGPDCRGIKIGDRVTAPFVLGCGHCSDCRAGEPTICEIQNTIGFTIPGAFAEQIAIPQADFNLVALPDDMSYVAAAGMGCRVTTAFRAVVDRGRLQPGEWLVVHGCGGVGLSAVMIGAALGAQVMAVDVNDEALAMAHGLGANAVLNAAFGDVGPEVQQATGGGGHVSVDALGITTTFENSLRSLRKMGRHVQIGMPVGTHATPTLPLLELVYARQLTLHGTRGLGPARFASLFEMISAGRMDPGRLVTQTLPLSGAHEALKSMDRFQNYGVSVIDQMDC